VLLHVARERSPGMHGLSSPLRNCDISVHGMGDGRRRAITRAHLSHVSHGHEERRYYSCSDHMIHGSARNADDYFRTALAAAFLAGALDDTIVIAPRFAANNVGTSCQDTLAPNELNWHCEPHPDDWRYGGTAVSHEALNAFDVIDETLRNLAHKDIFPNLRVIVVAGHSGGGSFIARYQAVNAVHEALGVPITYLPANAASYLYLDALRPTAAAYPVAAGPPGFVPPPPADPFVQFRGATIQTWPRPTLLVNSKTCGGAG
jgi:pimeloyl-ACP methyl ester carboxylesterase